MYTYCARYACGPMLASRVAGVYPGTLRGPIMSRKTLPLTVILLFSGGFGAAGCTGTDTDGGRKPPEICNDEIDNDDDGIIDKEYA